MTIPRWPVYVPSKGRSDKALTANALRRDGVPFYLVVEPQEEEAYRSALPADRLLVLPFSNLGQGSIPARNWIRDHAEATGHERHWQLDDNMSMFYRSWRGFRIPVHAGVALRVCEDFAARFGNVGVAGLNYDMFVPSTCSAPFRRNLHVYSCVLVDHAMPYRWRLRYNEDTDLCLQALTNGWATIQISAVCVKKQTTMMSSGGNTDSLYRSDGEDSERDTFGRYQMARMLEREWPGLVKIIRNFDRYQHSVNWKAFEDVPLRLREDVDLSALPEVDEYGMTLRQVRDVSSPRVRRLADEYAETVAKTVAPDPLWRGMPAFEAQPEQVKLRIETRTEEDRDALVEKLGVNVDKRFRGKGWSAGWPPRVRDDPASLRFEPPLAATSAAPAATTHSVAGRSDVLPRYPVYVPSKGRYRSGDAITVKALQRDGVPFYLVVEPQEADLYAPLVPADCLLVLPFSDLGQGSIPARNWIREHAEAAGHKRHWQLDDNISIFYRFWEGVRVPVRGGIALRVCEDLTDRFSNVGVSGLNYTMFVNAKATRDPFLANVHVYSCTLVNHAMPYRWRLRYNEDTDLCLQALTNGWATIAVNAFNAQKTWTMVMKGGNTDALYREEGEESERDTFGRYQMARMLEREWPGTVRVIRTYGRYQHSVNWSAFDVPLRLWDDVDLSTLPEVDEYGMVLRQLREPRNERVARLRDAFPEALASIETSPDPLWRGLPAFRAAPEPIRLRIEFPSSKDRDALVEQLDVYVQARFAKKGWSARWPPSGREDHAALIFEPGQQETAPANADPLLEEMIDRAAQETVAEVQAERAAKVVT